jgi:hypothetical protein
MGRIEAARGRAGRKCIHGIPGTVTLIMPPSCASLPRHALWPYRQRVNTANSRALRYIKLIEILRNKVHHE